MNLVIPIIRKEAELTKDAIIQALKPFAADNDREFCRHSEIAK
ncbi:MAG: hypothetical protein PHH59_06185 [Methylovulum sp.]|nr:hypothetical protein [Methylovulum sp.]MDD2723594.1 hypothetical protein [Methylovulum sp.]MDD5126130.1 hypothetical protein [Methylovulum sp.]